MPELQPHAFLFNETYFEKSRLAYGSIFRLKGIMGCKNNVENTQYEDKQKTHLSISVQKHDASVLRLHI